MNPHRLKQLRLARGLTLEALAASMGGVITKQALSKYEQAKAQPSLRVFGKLASALGVKTAHLLSEPEVNVRFIAYRKWSGLRKRDQEQVEGLVAQTLEDRVRLQILLQKTNKSKSDIPIQAFRAKDLEDSEASAYDLRKQWHLGLAPIASVTGVLESHLVHVIEINADEKFDGISAVASTNEHHIAAAVVCRRPVPGERQRFNLAHELGHLALKVAGNVDEERAAFRFATSFLAPAELIRKEIGEKRTSVRIEELLLLKRKFGMSLQALLYRLKELAIINESHYKQWCMDFNRLGWRKKEPAELPREQPQWLQENVLRALAEGLVDQKEADQLLGAESEEKPPLSLVEKRAFMKLSLEERRKILADEAERMTNYYERTSDWKDFF